MADDWDAGKATASDRASADDQLSAARYRIMRLVQHAAGFAESRARAATKDADRLSQQLRAADGRIGHLEAEVKYHQERVERVEQWLHRIYREIEGRFPTSRTSQDLSLVDSFSGQPSDALPR
jgi:predicted  nucleic acid-binding Zn-ribbon protein